MRCFRLSTLFSLLLTLILASCLFFLASSTLVAQVVPTDADQPRGIPTRIICKSNTCEAKSGNSPILSQAINFVIKSVFVYGTTYIVERIVSKLFTKRSAVHSVVNCSVAPLRATNHKGSALVLPHELSVYSVVKCSAEVYLRPTNCAFCVLSGYEQ